MQGASGWRTKGRGANGVAQDTGSTAQRDCNKTQGAGFRHRQSLVLVEAGGLSIKCQQGPLSPEI